MYGNVGRFARVAALSAIMSTVAFSAATITIVNGDGPGEGFNDPTPVAPIGGNTGTTIGQQRLIAFQKAAEIWGATISSSQPIAILSRFNPLSCDATLAVLGSAGASFYISNFAGSVPNTWYPIALAEKITVVIPDGATFQISGRTFVSIGVFVARTSPADVITPGDRLLVPAEDPRRAPERQGGSRCMNSPLWGVTRTAPRRRPAGGGHRVPGTATHGELPVTSWARVVRAARLVGPAAGASAGR